VRYSPLNTTTYGALPGVAADTVIGNANIKPESETEIETGFDATMFRSRAQFTFTVYQKRVTNLLLQATVGGSRGYSVEWLNGGEFTNQGVEISLVATPVQLSNGFRWVSSATFYRNYSVVNSLPSSVAPFGTLPLTWIQPGRSVSEIINQNFVTSTGAPLQVGDAQPSFVMSFNEALNWGPVSFDALVDWARGGNVNNFNDFYFAFGPNLWGDSAYSARFANSQLAFFLPSIQPATFVKLRQLLLAYTLPGTWTRGIGGGRLSSFRIDLVARNLLNWYSKAYTGLDPEVSSFNSQNVGRGDEITPYPPSRSFFLSLDLTF
jgi:hypothetical protein